GASHNFISPQVTNALGLKVTPVPVKSIKLGDGHKITSKGVCEGIVMQLDTVNIKVDVLVLELGGLDMGLGVSWLST
ncbi:retrotransposon gag protein, partial [Trifolium medium]|nr:retrotransposon gag protein [Trifolium medium]